MGGRLDRPRVQILVAGLVEAANQQIFSDFFLNVTNLSSETETWTKRGFRAFRSGGLLEYSGFLVTA